VTTPLSDQNRDMSDANSMRVEGGGLEDAGEARPYRPMQRVGAVLRVALAAAMLGGPPAWGATFSGVVVAVADGDTVTVLDEDRHQLRVRLAGIDAPEKSQAFGSKSREHLAALAFRQRAVVDFRKRDRYGRIVGRVTVDGRDIGLAQIESGMAWHFKQFQNEQSANDRQSYAEMERQARSARLGLWVDESPHPPWEFRARRKVH
jgi:endonuclease YncB( thermonuclease family)